MLSKQSTIFVTGGAGFIGSAVIRHLLAETAFNVVCIDKLTYASSLASVPHVGGNGRYVLEQVDICSGSELRVLFERYQPSAIMNLAAESHVDRSIDDPGVFVKTNIVGTFTLLQEALRYWQTGDELSRNTFRFLHVSTDEVFGSLGTVGFFTEDTLYAPNSPYAASKASSDHLVRAWHRTYDLPILITSCSNNYGAYQFPEKLIPHMIIRGLARKMLPVYGDGRHVRDWLYVEDHARALTAVLQRGSVGETYNVGGECERTNLIVVETICDLLDEMTLSALPSRRSLISFVDDRPNHDHRYAIDPSKIKRDLGWRARENFESGLRKTVAWYLQNREWWQDILDDGYKAERVGLVPEVQ